MNRPGIFALVIVFSNLVCAQPGKPLFSQVYVGAGGLAHVVTATGQDSAIAKEAGQVAVDSLRLSADRRFAGWMVEVDNCCTSYPIPTSVAVYSPQGKHLLGDGLMVYNWCFVPGKAQVVVATGTVHGWTGAPNLALYNAISGKTIRNWTGQANAIEPAWAGCLSAHP